MALAIDFSGPYVFGVRGFRVSPGHFSERFSLIVIIALGESIVAIGAGLTGELDGGVIVARAARPRARLRALVGLLRRDRAGGGGALPEPRPATSCVRIARDAYSYLHLPMIAGIVLVALGVKKTIGHVDEPLETVPAVALFGGVALYHGAHVGFRLRMFGTLNRQRLAALVACLALIPVGTEVDALVALGAGRGGGVGGDRVRGDPLRESRRRIRPSTQGLILHRFVT